MRLFSNLNTDRGVPGDELRNFHGSLGLFARCDNLLNEPDLVGALRVELVAQEQMIRCIAPAGGRS